MKDNNDSKLKKSLRDAETRYRIASEKHFAFLASVYEVGDRNVIPEAYNFEWCKTSDECKEALAELNKIVDSILEPR